jgi:2,4-dienoyl-CoA reductase-like NADH-dependent reductase (Old Yellow Enzyme family)
MHPSPSQPLPWLLASQLSPQHPALRFGLTHKAISNIFLLQKATSYHWQFLESVPGSGWLEKERSQGMEIRSLLEPISVRDWKFRNKMVMPPMVMNAATDDGYVSHKMIEYYRKRATGIGLVIVESSNVFPGGEIASFQLQIHDDRFISDLARLSESIKTEGARTLIQLNHGGAKAISSKKGEPLVSASNVPISHGQVPRSMTTVEISRMVEAFADAADRALAAGFDGVEIQACHFYVLSQFLSAYSNHREDEYGGSLEHRARFICEVVRAVRARIGIIPLISCRINGIESVDKGLTVEDAIQIGGMLRESGTDMLHVSGVIHSVDVTHEGKSYKRLVAALMKEDRQGAFVDIASQIRQKVGLPVIVAGKIFSPQLAESIVQEGKADMVAFGRQILVNEDFGKLMTQGKYDRLDTCDECYLCLQCLLEGRQVECAVNRGLFGR